MSSVGAAMSLSDVWNQTLAPKFIRHRAVLVAGAEKHGRRAMSLFGPRPADRALDIGCGFGDASLELAGRMGPSGFVTGIDLVPAFLDFARQAARERWAGNVGFTTADAETFKPHHPFDYLFARFGTMFFERPVAAFRNLHASLHPEGQLVMTTWRGLDENPWLGVAAAVAKAHLPPLPGDAISCGPGPFSLSDPDLIHTILVQSGFREISITPSAAATPVGETLDEAVDFQLALGPAGELVREAGERGQRMLPELRRALRAALAPYRTDVGVRMPSAAWIVHARP